MGWHSAWGWWGMPDDKHPEPENGPNDAKPKSYDIGLVSPYMRGFLLELARKHNPTSATGGIKKAAVDLLETAQPCDMDPGRLDWAALERKREKFGPHWSIADIFEREGRRK